MSESGLKKIGVIGIGTMGNGIAQVAAQSGFETVVMDVDAGALERGMDAIKRSLDRLVKAFEKSGGEKGITAEAKEVSINPKLGTYQVDVTDQSGTLVASFHGMVYRKKDSI